MVRQPGLIICNRLTGNIVMRLTFPGWHRRTIHQEENPAFYPAEKGCIQNQQVSAALRLSKSAGQRLTSGSRADQCVETPAPV